MAKKRQINRLQTDSQGVPWKKANISDLLRFRTFTQTDKIILIQQTGKSPDPSD